ncbi:hypothetical protein [Nocardioides sp.]|uniref:hypothetical protein n=1 Tax=Nocardioides sp. TaxID=35761 RepID=UPI002733EA6D|nr:hypothetical protein [Nocardioides sp.]MDP3892486.1 hypothetical protein [Nocardioides sp.]
MKSPARSRLALIAAGAVALSLFAGSTGAVANRLISGKDIAKGAVTSKHISDKTIKARDIKPGAVKMKHLAPNVQDKVNFTPPAQGSPPVANGITGVEVAALEAPVSIEKIGGPINDNNTDLEVGLTLPAGTYLVSVDGLIQSDVAAADPSVDVYPQISLWVDRSGDGSFQWQAEEGDISPNALMPDQPNRHISVSGQSVVTLTEETYVGLLAFGYTSTQGSERSGELDVRHALLTAIPLN